MIKKITVIVISLIVVIIIGGLAGHLIKGMAIRECVDKGGVWNYEQSRCDCYEIPDSSDVTNYTWFTVYNFCKEEFQLIKGAGMERNNFTSWELIRLLNQREGAYKIQMEKRLTDTIKVNLLVIDSLQLIKQNNDFLSNYLAETVYTLTEYGEFLWVEFLTDKTPFQQNDIFERENFSNLLESASN